MNVKRDIVRAILEDFNKSGLDYCVLRNYEFLIDESKDVEGDIDILISSEDFNKIDGVMRSHGFFAGRYNNLTKHLGYFRLTLTNKGKNLAIDFHLDGLSFNGVTYLHSNNILSRRKKIDFFYVPSDEDYFIELLIHSILDKKEFKEKYIIELRK